MYICMYVYNHDDDRLWRTTMMTEYDAETSFSTNVHAAYIKTSSAKCWADQQPRRSKRETSAAAKLARDITASAKVHR